MGAARTASSRWAAAATTQAPRSFARARRSAIVARPLSSSVVEDPPLFVDVRAAARDGPSPSRRSARLPTAGAVKPALVDPKNDIQRAATDAIIDAFVDDGERRATAVLPGGAGKTVLGLRVAEALAEYEETRKGPTSAIMLSSRVIGFVETGRGPVGWVRDVAFGVLGAAGIAGKIFLKNAVPVL